MTTHTDAIPSGLVVSCHRDELDAFMTIDVLLAFVKAAEQGGAVALRVEGTATVAAVRAHTALPIIGFTRGSFADGSELITPALDDIAALVAAGATAVAVDATQRKRPDGHDGFTFLEAAHARGGAVLCADVSTFREGVRAAENGAHAVATTLSGYTPDTERIDHRYPDIALVHELASALTVPVLAEGRIWTPEQAVACLEAGAWAVVVGSAITRPRVITQMFASAMKRALRDRTF